MTDPKPPAADGGPAEPGSRPDDEPDREERVVIRDNRKIRDTGVTQPAKASNVEPDKSPEPESAEPEPTVAEAATTAPEEPAAAGAAPAEPEPAAEPAEGALQAELAETRAAVEQLQTALEERTKDLQRVTAEYANYRKRAERDRTRAGEEAVANVFRELLPVFDDLDRAREHGELSDGVSAVVDQLIASAGKFGLTVVGEPGDPFDPNQHEAVAHRTSPDVSGPTCVEVFRRGYLLGERLLRPAMVVVADPEE